MINHSLRQRRAVARPSNVLSRWFTHPNIIVTHLRVALTLYDQGFRLSSSSAYPLSPLLAAAADCTQRQSCTTVLDGRQVPTFPTFCCLLNYAKLLELMDASYRTLQAPCRHVTNVLQILSSFRSVLHQLTRVELRRSMQKSRKYKLNGSHGISRDKLYHMICAKTRAT